MKFAFPEEILEVAAKLKESRLSRPACRQAGGRQGFEAYLVGGCVRDLLIKKEPKDWDIATNAKPDEIQKVFPESVYENDFGTVGVKTDSEDPKLKIVEVTTFRLDGEYTDKRHPDEVEFAENIKEDLSRRDFTINAMAIDLSDDSHGFVDPFGGQEDLKKGLIRTVGDPEERFNEDALRLMRAVRFAAETGFQIDFNTRRAIEKLAGLLEAIAKERIRDEFEKIIMSDGAAAGIILLEELDLLRYVMPELREGIGVRQNKHHIYTVFEHNVKSLDYSAGKNYSLEVRLASLLHDLGKPKAKRGEGPNSTFYGHDVVGAKMAVKALERLRFSKNVIERVAHLIRYHMFYYNVGEVTEAGVRRFIARVSPETLPDLLKLREADRIGSGVPKAVPYKMRHLLFMIEKVKKDPVSPKMLRVKGNDVMKILGLEPGPRVGQILAILLEEVLDNPSLNDSKQLESRMRELGGLSDAELSALSKKAKERKDEFQEGIEEEMKEKFHVK
ncbi:MAG TPA: HD domain-containing protein [Candidatus Paceibacterota bacterium]|nr:HD domain-containing protein [Candidatus Paceibacterota bacterium]